jgi:hypothetical protein
MADRVAKIHAASAVRVVGLTAVEAPRCAALGKLSSPNAVEDGIELGIADEGIVVVLELLVVVEKECERVVDTYRREMVAFRIGTEAKNASENCAAALLSRVGTMAWLRVIAIGRLSLRLRRTYPHAQERP